MAYTFEAVKGQQKLTEYYLTAMPFGEIDRLVVLPEDPVGKRLLGDGDEMQRKISWTRVRGEMKRYLIDHDSSFYSALTLFIVPRDMIPLMEGEDYEFIPANPGSSWGTLKVKSTCIFFPGDGQHRAASIREAVQENPRLADVEVPVVLIPFANSDQVRQLFADLNLNAKPVNRTIGLAFETRDPIALAGRELAESVPLFVGRVNRRTNSLSKSSGDVITMNTLYEGNKRLLAVLDSLKEDGHEVPRLAEIWQTMIDATPGWDELLRAEVNPATGKPWTAGDIRERYLSAHGLGWQAIARVAAVILRGYPEDWQQVLADTLDAVDWNRRNPDWQGMAVVGDRVNNTGPAISETTAYVLRKAGLDTSGAKPYLDRELSKIG